MRANKVIIESSGRHCHVTHETLDKLYGKGFDLVIRKMLSQPGQFATPHRVTLQGPRGTAQIAIVGPCRSADQVEIAMSDAHGLGLDPPIRESGDIAGSPGCKLIGPYGKVEITEGVIIAKRHIHFTPEDAVKYGVKDKQIVKVKVGGDRSLIFDEVVARVNPEFATYMHLDFDEFNAAGLREPAPLGEVIL